MILNSDLFLNNYFDGKIAYPSPAGPILERALGAIILYHGNKTFAVEFSTTLIRDIIY